MEGHGDVDDIIKKQIKKEPPKESKVKKFFTPLKQLKIATALALGIGITSSVGAVINNHEPDQLPTNEPVVRVLTDSVRMYSREHNTKITEWENTVKNKIKSGSIHDVRLINIDVQPGSESVKIRNTPVLDLYSGEPENNYQAELLPGFQGSFYGFKIDADTNVESPGDDFWVVYLPSPYPGEKPYLGFIKKGPLTEESVHAEDTLIPIDGLRFDEQGFPVAKIGEINQRIGVITPTSTPNPPGT